MNWDDSSDIFNFLSTLENPNISSEITNFFNFVPVSVLFNSSISFRVNTKCNSSNLEKPDKSIESMSQLINCSFSILSFLDWSTVFFNLHFLSES